MIYAQYRSQPSFVVRARKRRVVVAAPARAIDRSRFTARGRNARRVSLARGEPRREFRARTTRSIDRARARGARPHSRTHPDVRANLEHRHPRERPRARDEALREARDRGRARRGRNRGRGRAGAGQGATIRRRARDAGSRLGRSGGVTTRANARWDERRRETVDGKSLRRIDGVARARARGRAREGGAMAIGALIRSRTVSRDGVQRFG